MTSRPLPAFQRPAVQAGVVLGAFALVLLLGHAGIRIRVPFGLQVLEVGLAIAGAIWAGHRGSAVLAGLGLSNWTRRGLLLAVFGSLPMALGLGLPEVRGTLGGVYEALRGALGPGTEGVGGALSALMTGALLAPIGEELLFRGYAVGRLVEAGWTRGRALLALDAGLAEALLSGLITAAGGVWYGWIFLRWGRSVWVPLLAHVCMNAWWILGEVGPTAGSGGLLPNLGRGLAIALITVATVRWTEREPAAP